MWILLLTGAIICASIPTDALKCYNCIYTVGDPSDVCVVSPEDVSENPILDCDKKYCLSIRQEFVESKDKVSFVYRMCADSYTYKNKVVVDPYFRTHFKACETDLCNGGNGRLDDAGRDPDDGEELLLIVPGTQNGNILKVSYYLIFLILVPNIFKYIVEFL